MPIAMTEMVHAAVFTMSPFPSMSAHTCNAPNQSASRGVRGRPELCTHRLSVSLDSAWRRLVQATCRSSAAGAVPFGARSMVLPVQYTVPSGRVQVATRSEVIVNFQPPSWTM